MNPIRTRPFRVAGTVLVLAAAACGGRAEVESTAPVQATETRVRQAPPPPTALEPVSLPPFVEARLDNGARVIIVENHEQPVVSVNLRIDAGTTSDPGGLTGVADFTAFLLDKGTEERSATEIAEAIDFVGGSLGAGAGDDWTSVTLTVLTEFLDTGLELMSDVVLNPTFPQDELETYRRRMLTSLQLQKSQPGSLASRRFTEAVYGTHPYGKLTTEQSLRAIQRTNLLGFHRQNFRPNNALFVVAGDVQPERIVARLNQAFAGWEAGQVPAEPTGMAPEASMRELQFVHKPGSVQGVIRLGHLMPSATEADWPALDVATYILGGGVSGWMFRILRDEKGYTYGAYASASERRGPGTFVAQAEVRNEVADSAMDEMLRLIERLRSEPIPAEDLDAAKSYLTGSFPLTIETPQQVAGQIASEILLGRGADYIEDYRARVGAVTAADVQRVARQYLHPDRLRMVVVGDALQLFERLQPFATRAVIYDAEGGTVTLDELRPRASELSFDASRLPMGEREYAVMVQGNRFGSYTTELAREGANYRATANMAAGPMRIESAVLFTPELTPISATGTNPGGQTSLTMENGRVTGTLATQQGPQEVDVEVPQGTLLTGMEDLAIALTDLGSTPQFSFPFVDEGALSTATVRVVGEETVTVPAGEFETYKLELDAGGQSFTVWARKQAPHVLIRQEFAGQPVAIELESM